MSKDTDDHATDAGPATDESDDDVAPDGGDGAARDGSTSTAPQPDAAVPADVAARAEPERDGDGSADPSARAALEPDNDGSADASARAALDPDGDGSADSGAGGASSADESDDRPLVSVVVPTLDRPDMLAEAVESVIAQTYDPLELVVVDDGSSTDVRAAIDADALSELADVTLLEHDETRGANAARNTGIARASGDYVAFLDDDDYWRPEKVERQVEALRGAPESVGVAFVGREDVDGAGDVVNVQRPTTDGGFVEQLATGAHFGTFSTVMARADVFDRTGLLDERFPCWQDREWYFRVATDYDYVSVPELLTVRRIVEQPQISDKYVEQRDVAYPLLLEKHAQSVASLGDGYERRFRAELARGVGSAALSDGRYLEAVRFLVRSLRHDPLRTRTLAYLLVALGGPCTHRLAQIGRRRLHGT